MATDFATPRVFANARDQSDESDPERGQKLEVRIYESRYNSAGNRVTLSAGTKRSAFSSADPERHPESAFLVTRLYDKNQKFEYTEMEVRSPHVMAALRVVIKDYPGFTFDAGSIVIRDEPRCIFHYRDELRDYGLSLGDEIGTQHLVYFLNYMYNSLSREMLSYYTFMESSTAAPGIEHDLLWMVFKPGSLLVHTCQGIKQIRRLRSMQKLRNGSWEVETEKIAYNGIDLGWVSNYFQISLYDGYRPLRELTIFPLEYHPNESEIYMELIERGREYILFRELSHRSYSGIAETLSPHCTTDVDGDGIYPISPMNISGRIIIDIDKFGLVRPSHQVQFRSSDVIKLDVDDEPIISDEEWCLFDSLVPGFSLSAKRWCFFQIDRMIEFEYNTRAFESLSLPLKQKTMLSLLVRSHTMELQFDDLVKGKGRGLIFLLHGEPGVGKTLTAESLSDYTGRPLYSMSCGDLGTTATECEKTLIEVLDLATSWNAVLLIDEADVFLEQRSLRDLSRNGIVAVFLRLLEYFEGIMFLTTNRIVNFDAAFQSRIHLAIKYPGLSESSQRQLWTTFITNDSRNPQPDWLDEMLLDDLATRKLNGRQIRNVVRTAMALAVVESRSLEPQDIYTSLEAMEDFGRDFAAAVHDEPVAGNRDDPYSYESHSAPGNRQKRRRIE